MNRSSLLILLAAIGCNEYDLNRPDEQVTPGDTDEPEEEVEPSEDPDIAVDPVELDFGSVAKDCPADPLTLTVSNEGKADLTVDTITLSGNGSSAFNVQWDSVPFTLAYGESRNFQVDFTPNAWLDFDIEVEVTSNDPDENPLLVPTLGTGAEDGMFEESFEQDYYELVDVLWVVDNSGSMSDDLQRVADHFEDFITVFTDLGLDYHMAVVTTDMDNPGQSGRFVGDVITSATADPIAAFVEQVDQGSGGSGTEQGLAAVKAALTEPLLSSTNAGFLREDAALGVIVISDEDDSSSSSAATFASWIAGLKATEEMSTFSAVCEDLFISCIKYSEVADSTGGVIGDILATDYSEVMNQISMTSAGLTVSFDLSQVPSDLSNTTVTVGGSTVSNSQTNGWTYDSTDNAIVFHGAAVPDAGQTGVISYPVALECSN